MRQTIFITMAFFLLAITATPTHQTQVYNDEEVAIIGDNPSSTTVMTANNEDDTGLLSFAEDLSGIATSTAEGVIGSGELLYATAVEQQRTVTELDMKTHQAINDAARIGITKPTGTTAMISKSVEEMTGGPGNTAEAIVTKGMTEAQVGILKVKEVTSGKGARTIVKTGRKVNEIGQSAQAMKAKLMAKITRYASTNNFEITTTPRARLVA